MQTTIAVIGGGASGIMASICAAKAGAYVSLFESNERIGKKILSTGNGKCNFSNRDMSEDCYFCDDKDKLVSILQEFSVEKVIQFFNEAGMMIKDKNGYLYPLSEQASTVLDVLRIQLNRENVSIHTQAKINEIGYEKNRMKYFVSSHEGKMWFDKVILSFGGKAAPKTGSDGNGFNLVKSLGHTIIPLVPALVQVRCSEPYFKAIAGIREEADIRLMIDDKIITEEKGELQITDYGVSGIVIFQMSRIISNEINKKKKIQIIIDSMPDIDNTAFSKLVQNRKEKNQNDLSVEEFFTGTINKKLLLLFIKLAGLKPDESYKKANPKKIDGVFSLFKEWMVTVTGTNSFDMAQVTAGGIPLTEVTEKLESKIHKNLYFTGEALNVDGKCGGYNLHWAWASGYIAGINAAKQQ